MTSELKPWRYDIKHGPEGEAIYAWVYDGLGEMVGTVKAHKAKKIVDTMNTRAVPDVPELVRYDKSDICLAIENGYDALPSDGGEYVRHDQAAAIIAAGREKVQVLEQQLQSDDDAYSSGFDAGFGEANMTRNKRAEEAERNLAKENAKVAQRDEALRNVMAQRDAAEADNKRLREALEFYADTSKYPAPLTGGMGELWADCGGKARAALGEQSE